jgi:hypothetical protein
MLKVGIAFKVKSIDLGRIFQRRIERMLMLYTLLLGCDLVIL